LNEKEVSSCYKNECSSIMHAWCSWLI
jgi:hypothetical protein